MPIIFSTIIGQRKPSLMGQSNLSQTIIVWHQSTLRFVVVQLQSLLYGLDIASYSKSISLQLNSNIPLFEQLVDWCSNIDPKAVSAKLLVGQIIENYGAFNLQLQASESQLIWLIRGQQKYKLGVTKAGLRGSFKPGDQLIIGCQTTINRIDKSQLGTYKQTENKIIQLLNNQTQENKLLLINHIKLQKGISLDWIKSIKLPVIKRHKNKDVDIIFPQEISVKRISLIGGKRKFALILAVVFLIILFISVSLGINKRAQLTKARIQQQLISDVTYRLEQAKSLQDLNPSRSKTLLTEAKQALNEYIEANKLNSPTIKDLEGKVAQAYEQVSGLILIAEAPIFYDPNLIKDGFKPTQMVLSQDDLTLLDSENKLAGTVSLTSKSAQIVAGSSQVLNNSRLASIPAWTFLLSGEKLAIIDKQTQKQIKSFTLTSTTVSDMVGYGNNLYVLDVPAGQVLRFRGIKDGLSKSEEFFSEKQDLTGSVSLAVDGSVWILYGNGAVEKYTSGIRDALYPDYGLDKPFQQASQLFTDENQKQLYILSKSQGRIIAISKLGEFKAEYTWEGLKTCDDFVVSEQIGKILVLKDGKIWGINIK